MLHKLKVAERAKERSLFGVSEGQTSEQSDPSHKQGDRRKK